MRVHRAQNRSPAIVGMKCIIKKMTSGCNVIYPILLKELRIALDSFATGACQFLGKSLFHLVL